MCSLSAPIVKKHAGLEAGAEVELTQAPAAVAKAVAMNEPRAPRNHGLKSARCAAAISCRCCVQVRHIARDRPTFLSGEPGQQVTVTKRTAPLLLVFTTSSGPAPLPPVSFAIMPRSNSVILVKSPTLQDLGIDPCARLWDSMQIKCRRLVREWTRQFVWSVVD